MKRYTNKKAFFVTFVLTVMMIFNNSGCGNNNSYLEKLNKNGYSKALQPDDPNLDPDWDWYTPPGENNNYQKYTLWSRSGNSGGISGGDVVQHNDVQLPYFDQDGGPAGSFFIASQDYLPDDGWVLLCKNFGDMDPPRQPFYMLYNKGTGVIRIFFFYTGEEASYVKIILQSIMGSPDSNSEKTALFTFNKEKYNCLDTFYTTDTNKNIWNGIVTFAEVMPNKWSHADFVLSYDPIKRTDVALEFKFSQIEISDIDLSGQAKYDSITKTRTVNKSTLDIIKAAFSSGQTIAAKGQKIYSEFNSSSSTDNNSSGKTMAAATKNSGSKPQLKVDPFTVVSGAIAIGGAVASFINAIQPTKTSYIAAQWYDIDLSGTIKKETPYDHIIMNVPGGHTGPNNIAPLKVLYDKPLGVFSMEKKPKVAFRKLNSGERTYSEGSKTIDEEYWEYGFGLAEPLAVAVNNIPGFKVKTIEASFVWKDRLVNREINGENGLKNYKPVSELFETNCYSDNSIMNINTEFLNGETFYNREITEYWGHRLRKTTSSFTLKDSSVYKYRTPLVQIKIELERAEPVAGENNVVTLLKTYTPEYLDEAPEAQSPSTMMEIKQDNQFIYPNRIFHPYTVNLIPSEYGVAQPQRLIYTINNYSTTENLELTHDPKIIVQSATPEYFTVVKQPDAVITPGSNTTFELEFFSDVQGTYSASLSIPSSDYGASPYRFVVVGEVVQDHSGFQAMAPGNFTATIASSTEIKLNWQDNSTVESGFKVYRKLEGEDGFQLIKSLSPNTTTYSDSELVYTGEKRWYWVTVYNNEGETFPRMSYIPIGINSLWDEAVFGDKNNPDSNDPFFH